MLTLLALVRNGFSESTILRRIFVFCIITAQWQNTIPADRTKNESHQTKSPSPAAIRAGVKAMTANQEEPLVATMTGQQDPTEAPKVEGRGLTAPIEAPPGLLAVAMKAMTSVGQATESLRQDLLRPKACKMMSAVEEPADRMIAPSTGSLPVAEIQVTPLAVAAMKNAPIQIAADPVVPTVINPNAEHTTEAPATVSALLAEDQEGRAIMTIAQTQDLTTEGAPVMMAVVIQEAPAIMTVVAEGREDQENRRAVQTPLPIQEGHLMVINPPVQVILTGIQEAMTAQNQEVREDRESLKDVQTPLLIQEGRLMVINPPVQAILTEVPEIMTALNQEARGDQENTMTNHPAADSATNPSSVKVGIDSIQETPNLPDHPIAVIRVQRIADLKEVADRLTILPLKGLPAEEEMTNFHPKISLPAANPMIPDTALNLIEKNQEKKSLSRLN